MTTRAIILSNNACSPETEQARTNAEPLDCIHTTDSAVSDFASEAVSMVHRQSCEVSSSCLRFGKKLGTGQFGVVMRGDYNGQACAVKRLKAGVQVGSMEHDRLMMELSILASIGSHPNLVGFIGACIQDLSAPLILEELVAGPNLEDHLSAKPFGFNLGQPKVRHRDIAVECKESFNQYLVLTDFLSLLRCSAGPSTS